MEPTNKYKGWLYLLPAILFLGCFMVYPLVDVFVYSMEEGYNFASQTFFDTGFYNFSYVLHDPYFLQAVKNTFLMVVPLFNEEESLPELRAWIERVMNDNGFSYEIIFVNDGSTDGSWKVIERFAETDAHVHGIKFRRNYGKSPALFCGFRRAEGRVVITMESFRLLELGSRRSFAASN